MAIRNIVKEGDDLLRKNSRDVVNFNKKLHDLLDDMADTMYEANGVGLAGPQVGILRNVFVVDVGEGIFEFINPKISNMSGKAVDSEGCLSVPGLYGYVERPEKLKIDFVDRNGEEQSLEAEGFFARAICHEYDHLVGTLFVDKAPKLYTIDEINAMEGEE